MLLKDLKREKGRLTLHLYGMKKKNVYRFRLKNRRTASYFSTSPFHSFMPPVILYIFVNPSFASNSLACAERLPERQTTIYVSSFFNSFGRLFSRFNQDWCWFFVFLSFLGYPKTKPIWSQRRKGFLNALLPVLVHERGTWKTFPISFFPIFSLYLRG